MQATECTEDSGRLEMRNNMHSDAKWGGMSGLKQHATSLGLEGGEAERESVLDTARRGECSGTIREGGRTHNACQRARTPP